MKKILIGFSLLAFLFFINSCKKSYFKAPTPVELSFDQNKLPILANNGGDYFGFLTDGNVVWGQKQNSLDGAVKGDYNIKNNLMQLSFSHKLQSLYIDIRSNQLNVGDVYPLKDLMSNPLSSSANYYESTEPVKNDKGISWSEVTTYETYDDKPGFVKITNLDFQNRIISGEFELTVVQKNKNTQKNISKGRFDIKYRISN